MNSKQRAYLRKLSAMEQPLFHIGKSSVTPQITEAIDEALAKRELVKVNVLKNCFDDVKSIASVISDRTHSEVVHVIGRRFVLYRMAKEEKDRKIDLNNIK